jgi:hypothetical protein
MLIYRAFYPIPIRDRECIIEELAPTHEIVSGEPIKYISSLVGISTFVSSQAAS